MQSLRAREAGGMLICVQKEAPDLLLTHHTQTLKGGIVMKKLAMIREFLEEYYKSFSASYRG